MALLAVMVVYRAYGSLLRQHADLGQLFAFTQTVAASASSDDIVSRLLHQARELLQAEQAVLRPVPPRFEPGADLDGEPLTGPLVIPRNTRDPVLRSWLDRAGLRDALIVPLHDDSRPGRGSPSG